MKILRSLALAAAMLVPGGRCADCPLQPSLTCIATCFTTSALVGLAVGHQATRDREPHRFALAAVVSAALAGALGCGTTGLGGALGIACGLVAGSVAGWATAARAR